MTFPIVGQEFALERCDIHVHRALGFAGAAFEAQIQDVIYALVAKPGLVQLAGYRHPQRVRTASRGSGFVVRRHVGRAHSTGKFLAASADAAAHFDRARHASVLGKIEPRRGFTSLIADAESETRRERRRIHDLSGIQDAERIKSALDLAKRLVEYVAKELPHKRASHQAVAVLARQRAA